MNQNQTKRAFWQQRFEAQRVSGLGVTAWCQQEGITCSTYYYWRQRNMDKKSGRKRAIRHTLTPDPTQYLRG